MFTVFVPGKPQPQGSKSAYMVGGKPVLVESAKGHKAWRESIKKAIAAENPEIIKTAVHVSIIFYFERAKSNTKPAHTQKPDLDKLCRSVLDSLGDLIIDDSFVTSLSAYKYWVTEPQDRQGAFIAVWAVDGANVSIDTPTT